MPPRPKPFKDCVIALCGRFGIIDNRNYTHEDFKAVIKKYGGVFTKSIDDSTTHIVATAASLGKDTAIMVAAKKKERVVAMKPKWLAEAKSLEGDAKEYMWKDWRNQGKSDKPKRAKSITKSSAKPKTKADAKAKDKAKTKGYYKATDDSKTSAKRKTKAGSKAKDKARTKADAKAKDKPKPPAQYKTKAKSKTSVEPLTEYDVWVDDSGLRYDAYLTQTSSVTNRDKFYWIQVRKDPESSTFKTRTKWAGVDKKPMYQVLGNGGLEDAVKEFKKKFKLQSGLAWENRFASRVPEKYKYVHHSGGDNDTTDHS